MATDDRDRARAEQQGDGQPENQRELEDPSGGSARADGAEDGPAAHETPGAGTATDRGTRGTSGGTTPPESRPPSVNIDRPSEEDPERRVEDWA